MATLYNPLNINGVISTDKTALQNLNDLCSAAGAFLTYDISQGKWAVIINKAGTSVKSYNDANIIGSINVSETGVSELYNSARLEFPHRLLMDETDFVEVTIPVEDRFPNEVANTLNIQSDLINDPVQAQYIAGVELKQSRLNKIITFTTDYTSLGMKAGDLIDVTAEMYGYTNKVFRIITLEENDTDVIGVTITAMEYSEDVYSTTGLVAVEKTKKTGILLKQQNTAVQEAEDANINGAIVRMLAANVGLGIANNLLNKLFGRQQIGTDANGNPIYSNKTKPSGQDGEDIDKLLANAKRPALDTISSTATDVCEGGTVTITVGHSCTSCLFNIPDFDYPYTITGISSSDIDKPLTGTVKVISGTGSIAIAVTADAISESSEEMTFTIGGLSTVVNLHEAKDYTYVVSKNNASITEGGNVTVTLTTTGSKLNATVPYEISGSAASKVTSPALTGNVTVVNGIATLAITTSDDAVYTGTQGLTVTFEPDLVDPCETVGINNTVISVLDNEPAPPVTPPDYTRQYTAVPVVWTGVYDGATNQLKGVTALKSAYLPLPYAGESTVAVPLTVDVSPGTPSTLTVTSTINVASASTIGGAPISVITAFDQVAVKGHITGTKSTLYGYF